MSKTSKGSQKRRDFIGGMLAATLISLMFWGLISLWYSGHPDTDYKLTPVLIFWALPFHISLLGIITIYFRANTKRLVGFICAGAIAFMLDLPAMMYSGLVISSKLSVPLDTTPLLCQILLAWASILLLFMLI